MSSLSLSTAPPLPHVSHVLHVRHVHLPQVIVEENPAAPTRWCKRNGIHCSNFASVVLLAVSLIIMATYLILHNTAIMDVMVSESDARFWVGVTPTVQIFSALVLIPAFIHNLVVLGQMTVCWQGTKRKARVQYLKRLRESTAPSFHDVSSAGNGAAGGGNDDRAAEDDTMAGKCWKKTLACVDLMDYHLMGVHCATFYWQLWSMEVIEFVVQALALKQLSEDGISRATLTVYVGLRLVRFFNPSS